MQKLLYTLSNIRTEKVTIRFYKIFFLMSALQYILLDTLPFNFVTRNEYAIPKLFLIFSATIHLEEIAKALIRIWERKPLVIVEDGKISHDDDIRLDNVPLDHLIEFLLKQKGRPVQQAKKTFGLTTSQHKKLGDNLERVGILVRGENNARVISDMHPDQIIDIMCKSEDSNDLQPRLIRGATEGSYTFANHSPLASALSSA